MKLEHQSNRRLMERWAIAFARVATAASRHNVVGRIAAIPADWYDMVLRQFQALRPAVCAPVTIGDFDRKPLISSESTRSIQFAVSTDLTCLRSFGRHLLRIVCVPLLPSGISLVSVTKPVFTLFSSEVILVRQIIVALPLLAFRRCLPLPLTFQVTFSVSLPPLAFMRGMFSFALLTVSLIPAFLAHAITIMFRVLTTRRADYWGFDGFHQEMIIP